MTEIKLYPLSPGDGSNSWNDLPLDLTDEDELLIDIGEYDKGSKIRGLGNTELGWNFNTSSGRRKNLSEPGKVVAKRC